MGEKARQWGDGKAMLGIAQVVSRRTSQENRSSVGKDVAGSGVSNPNASQPEQRVVAE